MTKITSVPSLQNERVLRYFSDDFKRRKVEEIDSKMISIGEICRQYSVSRTSVYKWINKFSVMRKKSIKMVIESDSDTARIKALQDQVAQLEQMLGQKQFEVEFMKKQMEMSSDKYGIDFKKKPSGSPSNGSGTIKGNTVSK